MRLSKYLVPTLREDPAEAEIVSHRLMLRAGMIRRTAAGIYSYLPLGLRALRKVEGIVRAEMDRAGALEVFLPVLSPAELWRETGRWDVYGKELMRVRDRHDREFCLGPTHEEVITDLVRRDVRSWRQLPGEPLPDPDEVPRRDPPALRVDARARVRHEGRLQLRPRRGGRRGELPRDVRRLHPDLRALRPALQGRGGRLRADRRLLLPRVHGARRHRRGRGRDLHGLRLRREPREGPGRGARAARRRRRRARARAWRRRRCARSRRSRRSSASARTGSSRRCSSTRAARSSPSWCAAITR